MQSLPAKADRLDLPSWVETILTAYNSHACNQFILSGNIDDFFPAGAPSRLRTLPEIIQDTIVPRYDVVISYDIGNGIRVERGAEIFGKWNEKPAASSKDPAIAIELITIYLRYVANLGRLGQSRVKTAVILKDAHLFASEPGDARSNSISFLIREWSREPLLLQHDIVSFLLTESFSELHPLLRRNSSALRCGVDLPGVGEISRFLELAGNNYPIALKQFAEEPASAARELSGGTIRTLNNLLKIREHAKAPLAPEDLHNFKVALIGQECPGLLEVLPPKLSLANLHGQEALKQHLRQNAALWKKGRLDLLPMGYLICGPVGTGKTFLVRCLAGESSVPVIVLKNFRDKWYGSTEANLEKIFRTIQAIGQCYVFIDEADQALGRRDSGASEPGVSGRIYSMLAQEMSNKENRGRVVWVLATSRPDLLEIDLKRPGRIDLKVPIFPASTPLEAFKLLQAIALQHQLEIPDQWLGEFENLVPDLLTAGEADALLSDLRREIAADATPLHDLLRKRLSEYLPPVPHDIIRAQIALAVHECSRADFIPPRFREM